MMLWPDTQLRGNLKTGVMYYLRCLDRYVECSTLQYYIAGGLAGLALLLWLPAMLNRPEGMPQIPLYK